MGKSIRETLIWCAISLLMRDPDRDLEIEGELMRTSLIHEDIER